MLICLGLMKKLYSIRRFREKKKVPCRNKAKMFFSHHIELQWGGYVLQIKLFEGVTVQLVAGHLHQSQTQAVLGEDQHHILQQIVNVLELLILLGKEFQYKGGQRGGGSYEDIYRLQGHHGCTGHIEEAGKRIHHRNQGIPKQNEEKNEARNIGGAHIGLHLESKENADTQNTGDGVVQHVP